MLSNMELKTDDLFVISANNQALLMNAKRKLVEAKEIQKTYDELKVKLDNIINIRCEISNELDHIKLYKKLVDREDASYKDKRTHFIESQIEEPMSLIFPTKNFKAKLNMKPFRNKIRASLKLQDKFGRVSHPKMGEGKFCQQLISFAGSTAIAKTYGMDKVFTDEAFSASSPENLTKVGNILKDLIEDGRQIILVEQQDTIYKDITRREIRIDVDPITEDVLPLEVVDY